MCSWGGQKQLKTIETVNPKKRIITPPHPPPQKIKNIWLKHVWRVWGSGKYANVSYASIWLSFEDLYVFQKICVFGCHFSKCIFAEGSFNQKPLALGEIRGAIWRYFVMELPSKNVKNHKNLRLHNSVRPDPTAPGDRKLRVVFPLISVLSKRPQLQYWSISGRKRIN